MLSKFRKVFHAYPLLSNLAIAGGFACAGDVIQRKVLAVNYDWKATARITTVVSCVTTPVVFYAYKAYDKYLPGRSLRVVLMKMAMDGILVTPPMLAAFFIGISILEGQKDVFAECKEKVVKTYIADVSFWFPVQLVNFFLVPPHLRVVYVSCCSLGWSCILCFIKGQPMPEKEVLEEA